MKQKKIERRALVISSIGNFIMAFAGIWMFLKTDIQALFLDGFFSFIALISTLFAIIISKISRKKTKVFPEGLHFLEPLYAILKSLLVLVLLFISIIRTGSDAYQYFYNGVGDLMITDSVLAYTVLMVIICFSLSYFNKIQNQRINNISTMLNAESKSNFVDGIQSLGIGIGVVILKFIDINGSLGFLHYTADFFITLILVLFTFKEPIDVIVSSFRELVSGTISDKEIRKQIEKVIKNNLSNISVKNDCKIYKVGMYIKIEIYIKEETSLEVDKLLEMAEKNIIKELKQNYENIELEYIF